MYGYIYLTKDLETGLIYIGQKKSSKFLDKKYLGSGTSIRTLLGSGVTEDRFEIQMIDTAESADELNEKEIYWIEAFDAMNPRIGYNRCRGGITNTGFSQSDYQKTKLSDYMKNRDISDITKEKMSISARNRTSNRITNGGYVWMHKDDIEKMVDPNNVPNYLDNGFIFGRIEKSEEYKNRIKDNYNSSTYMIKDGICKLIPNSEVETYKTLGWDIGRTGYSAKRGTNISNSKSGTIRMINPETLKVKYIKPEDIDSLISIGFIPYTEYKKKTS